MWLFTPIAIGWEMRRNEAVQSVPNQAKGAGRLRIGSDRPRVTFAPEGYLGVHHHVGPGDSVCAFRRGHLH